MTNRARTRPGAIMDLRNANGEAGRMLDHAERQHRDRADAIGRGGVREGRAGEPSLAATEWIRRTRARLG